jgi:hypothetical protein
MSNNQWNSDQAIGERAMREHHQIVESAPDMLTLLEEILDLWPQINCVCGRGHSWLPRSLRERAKSIVSKARGRAKKRQ